MTASTASPRAAWRHSPYNGPLFRVTISGATSWQSGARAAGKSMLVYPSEPGHYKIKLWHGRFAPAASYETYTTVPVVSAQRTFDIIPTNQSGTPNGNISYVAVQGMQVSSYGLLNQTNGLYSVSMNGCALSSFPYFEGAANIQSLNLAYNGLTAFENYYGKEDNMDRVDYYILRVFGRADRRAGGAIRRRRR